MITKPKVFRCRAMQREPFFHVCCRDSHFHVSSARYTVTVHKKKEKQYRRRFVKSSVKYLTRTVALSFVRIAQEHARRVSFYYRDCDKQRSCPWIPLDFVYAYRLMATKEFYLKSPHDTW